MQPDLLREISKRIQADFEFRKTNGGWHQSGKCPTCQKKELFTRADEPWVMICGRKNHCGAEFHVKDLYPDLFENWGDRYQKTPEAPNAAADAYLRSARGFDLDKIAGCYVQENYYDPALGFGSTTVRFPMPGGHYWERIIDQPQRFGKKKAHFNTGASYAGKVWTPPMSMPADEIWIVEGIFDAIALMHGGIWAASAMSCSNYPATFLSALADQCASNDRPRPKLVFALDGDAAGQRYMKKHIERATKDGWTCSVALIRQRGKAKQDWNDLWQLGHMKPEDIEECRYWGSLFTAKSAADKGALMYRRKNWSRFYFDFENSLYWFEFDDTKYNAALERIRDEKKGSGIDDEKCKELALEQSRSVAKIANCKPTALYFQANKLTDESWYYIRIDFPHDGAAVKNTFTGSQLSSSSEFKKRLLAIAPGALFTGNAMHLDLWLQKQMFGIKTVETIDFIGYSKDHGAWVFDDLAVKDGRVHTLNDEDFFDIGKLSIKSLNQSVNLSINPDDKEYSQEWTKLLWKCFGTKGYVALAFWLGSLFAEQIRDQQASYPFIEIVGEPGSGKSTLIEFMWKLVGRTGYEGFDPQKATIAARARNFAQVSNLPVVLIESDRDSGEDGKLKQKAFDWDELKTAYNGRSVRSTGVKNSGNDTREPPFRAALVISQNAPVAASDAFMQRLMHVHFTLKPHTDASRDAFQRLERMPVESVSGFLLAATKLEAKIMQTLADRTPEFESYLDKNPNVKHFRIIKNHAQLMALLDALRLVVKMTDEAYDAIQAEIVRMAEERQQAINADHPRIQEFWDLVDYLESLNDEEPVLNHSRDEGLIAINMNEFIALATDRRQQLPDMNELKKQLKTSRTRKFLDIKTVNSAINGNWNVLKRAHNQPKKPESVKCWVFRREA